jgi:hypothetical protein
MSRIAKKVRVQDMPGAFFQTMACQIIQQNHEAGSSKTKRGRHGL